MDIKEKIKNIPRSPGVYFMKDLGGEIIYIGKAKDLFKRVGSYFRDHVPVTAKLTALLENVKDLDYIVTSSEEEALIFEANLIKEKKPKYNAELKDDKSFPFLKLTIEEDYPRLFITRTKTEDGSRYFGPYTRVKLLRSAVNIMKAVFPLRTCKSMQKHVCLSFHLGYCAGPCVGKSNKKKYREIVDELILFLEGKKEELLKKLTEKMETLSKKRAFEEAAIVRDRISALSEVPGKRLRDYSSWQDVSLKLKKLLRLPRLPARIEAFDISNIGGKFATGSMVSFYKGEPDKSSYRKFKIKNIKCINDYAMISEVVGRRYRRLKEENRMFPDLIIIDGGKGHLKVAYEALLKLNLTSILVISIAKEDERIYALGSSEDLDINKDSGVMHFVQRVRDEAHRFALGYHTKLRALKR